MVDKETPGAVGSGSLVDRVVLAGARGAEGWAAATGREGGCRPPEVRERG